MRREISEVKQADTKNQEGYLDSSVRASFERLQEGKIARAEDRLDSSVRKSFEKLEFHSTYEERPQQTPKEETDRGEWSGQRGESTFKPSDLEIGKIMQKYNMEGVEYKNAIPDFSRFSVCTVEIKDMTENRERNFKQCDCLCAEQWNVEKRDGKSNWEQSDVKDWRQKHEYSWHERNDMKTCDLIPTSINAYFGHLGGVSECYKRDTEAFGGGFDD